MTWVRLGLELEAFLLGLGLVYQSASLLILHREISLIEQRVDTLLLPKVEIAEMKCQDRRTTCQKAITFTHKIVGANVTV